MKLSTERLSLTEVSLAYLTEIHNLHSLAEIDEFNTLGIPESIDTTKDLITEWVKNQQLEPRPSYVFCIQLIETNQFIGLIGLSIGKIKYKIAEVWYKTDPLYWRKGYTTEALFEILKFGFLKLNLHRIEAGCAIENIASIRVLEKVGMTKEGRRRELLPIRGRWLDNYIFAILENEFTTPA